jgi:exopolyphosphatase/guanosine-5'-triphosphate,3'-diphosphate pyrophosphatase
MPSRSRSAERATLEQRAIIDIGSNTIRMVIYGGPDRAPVVLFNEKVSARLGKGVLENGAMSEKSMGVALSALARFATLLRLRNVPSVEVVATAAVRDASNGEAFLASIAELGLSPRLLSGEEEAMTSALGVAGAFPGAHGVVADLGGGSLELVTLAGDHCEHGVSLPLGSFRLPQMRLDGTAMFASRIHKVIKSARWRCEEGQTLYLVGGSHRAIARYAMQQLNWPIDDPHGFELSLGEALATFRKIVRGKLPPSVSGLSSSRLANLPDTAALLLALIKEIRPSRLVFCAWGLREGLLYSNMSSTVRQQDPLIAGVSAFAEAMGASPSSAAMVAGWTAAAIPPDGAHRENLRLAATMLALAAQRLEPNLRAEHAFEWALRKRWIGIDMEDRAVIAACLMASADGDPSLSTGIERLAAPQSLAEAEAWGLAIRLCRRLTGVSAQAIANSALRVDGERLVLSTEEPFGALVTDVIAKDLRNLATKLGLAGQTFGSEIRKDC